LLWNVPWQMSASWCSELDGRKEANYNSITTQTFWPNNASRRKVNCHSFQFKKKIYNLRWNAYMFKLTVFWDVAPCSLVDIYRRFRGACCPHPSPDWWRQQAPLKHWSISSRLHGSISQKTVIFIFAAVRRRNLTYIFVIP
jgi:hypothetical protein